MVEVEERRYDYDHSEVLKGCSSISRQIAAAPQRFAGGLIVADNQDCGLAFSQYCHLRRMGHRQSRTPYRPTHKTKVELLEIAPRYHSFVHPGRKSLNGIIKP